MPPLATLENVSGRGRQRYSINNDSGDGDGDGDGCGDADDGDGGGCVFGKQAGAIQSRGRGWGRVACPCVLENV